MELSIVDLLGRREGTAWKAEKTEVEGMDEIMKISFSVYLRILAILAGFSLQFHGS